MATLPGSGSDGGFFLLKGSHFSPQLPHAHSGDWTEEKFRCNLLISFARQLFFEIGSECIIEMP